MNYVILKKGTILLAVDVMSDSAGEEIRGLQDQCFEIVCKNMEALSSGNAIKAYQNKGTKVVENKELYKSNYGIAQFVVGILSFIGWETILVGVMLVLIGFGSSSKYYELSFIQHIGFISPGFITMVSGLFSIAASQIVKATVDNADHSYQIMMHLKSK